MRLIDAEGIIKILQEMSESDWNIRVGSSKGIEDAIDVIEEAQTIEERPKGKWIWTSCNPYDENIGRWSCSICNYEPNGKLTDEKVHYCPNCGAKMRGEENEKIRDTESE